MALLKSERMQKITITGPNGVMDRVVKELHSLKIVHITDHIKGDIDIGRPSERANRVSELLVLVRAISANLNIKGSNHHKVARIKNYYELGSTIKKLHSETTEKINRLKALEENINRIRETKNDLEKLALLPLPLEAYSDYKSIAYFVGKLKTKNLEAKIKKLSDRFELYSNRNMVALFIEAKRKNEANEVLLKENFAAMDLSRVAGLKGMPAEQLERLGNKENKLAAERTSLQKQLEKMCNRWKDFLLVTEDLLSTDLEKAQAPLKFASTKQAFVITGWVPTDELDYVEKRLNEITKNKVFIQLEETKKTDKIPVKLKNPAIAKPFEFFIRLYNLPLYTEIDPTFIMFLTFPFLFGFILGDVGYGLVTLATAFFLKNRFKKGAALFNIMIVASIATIVFGALFGEFFGEEVLFGMELPHILNRAHQINILMAVAVIIGIIHLNLGFLLGFYNELGHGIKKAVFAKLSWIFMQIGVGLIAASKLGYLNIPIYYGIAIFLASIVMLVKGESILGIIEVPTVFSNILSYARLMAVGLASVELAIIINELAKPLFHKGFLFIILGVILLVVGHTLNIALGILSSFLQSLRLHYVEFFTKFFKGGAIEYRPFGLKSG